MNLPFISIVLATKNEEKNIERCLMSIEDQSYPRSHIEIIVVDNDSTDATRRIAQTYTPHVLNLSEMIDLKSIKNFRGAQLNLGVKHAKGEIIFFPDADMTFDKELLSEAARLISKDKYDALYIPETVVGKGLFGKIRNFERSFYNMTCIDGLRIVRKSVYERIGGFDEKDIKFGPDDWDFTKTVKGQTDRLTITTHSLHHHEVHLDFLSYLSKKSKYVHTFSGYKTKWGNDDPDAQKQFSFYYRFFGVFIERGKWKMLVKNPLFAIGMYITRFLVGVLYLINPHKYALPTPKLIAFMNAYSHGKAGGDMVFIETALRLQEYKKIVITSALGKTICQQSGLKAQYLITSKEKTFRNVIGTYIKRTLQAFFLKIDVQPHDIVLGTSDFFPDVLPICWLKLWHSKIRWVQHVFHLIPTSRKIPFLTQQMSLFLIKHFADLIVVDNQILKTELIQLGINPEKIEVNYPGLDLKYLQSILPATSGYEGVFIGQLRVSKGIFDLIEIWKRVCIQKPNAKLGIIGKGSKEVIEQLTEAIDEAKLGNNIDLLGFMESSKAFSIIKASKIFVFPSHEEGFGIAALEAQALGLPVVAWNLPVFAEIFPEGMIQVGRNDIKKFAKESLQILNNEGLHKKLSIEAVTNSRRYDWDMTAKRELACFGTHLVV